MLKKLVILAVVLGLGYVVGCGNSPTDTSGAVGPKTGEEVTKEVESKTKGMSPKDYSGH